MIASSSANNIGFMIQLSGDLSEIKAVIHFPKGTVRDINRIRTDSMPGSKTGFLYISGSRDNADPDGYYLAKLNANFIDEVPSKILWSYDVDAKPRRTSGGASAYKSIQPWDVGSDGKIVFGRGTDYDYDWAAIERLDSEGKKRDVVDNWPCHWIKGGGEYRGKAFESGKDILYSAIVMKPIREGSMRSKTQHDYSFQGVDENGNPRRGRYPDDYYFRGPLPESKGPGYTGYNISDKPTARVGAIVINRIDNSIYYGYSTQSRLPGGKS